MNIVLIGYRGCGKTSVAPILADRLRYDVISTDAEIISRTGFSVPEIIRRFGWDHFRDLESEVCLEIVSWNCLIIDTGGGIILRPQNVEALKRNGILFWLTASIQTIQQRIGSGNQRPSLTGAKSFIEEIEEVLREREPTYAAAADHIIPTDNRTIIQVADSIISLVRLRKERLCLNVS